MKACWWPCATHYRAIHDKTSIPTARWHVYEAIHGKSKYIELWNNYNNLGKIEYHVKNLPGTFYSKRRARLRHARALHNCKQGHGRIEHNYIYKTSFLNIPKRSTHLSVGTWIHDNKITAVKDSNILSLKMETSRSLVCMLVLVTTYITKIHGIHPCKEDMA